MNCRERFHRAPLSLVLIALMPLFVGCAGPMLVVEHEGNTAWMTMSNSFAGGHPGFPDNGSRPYWNGLLFQLGEYPKEGGGSLVRWGGVVLVKGNGDEILKRKGEFSWINVVSQKEQGGEPLSPDQALLLYPSMQHTSCEEDPTDGCLRNRRLHRLLDPEAVITYWQGTSGFGVAVISRAEEGTARHFNTQRFKLGDPVVVTVYKEEMQDGVPTMVKIDGPYKDIKEIRVIVDSTGPEGGGKRDPAWPISGGGG